MDGIPMYKGFLSGKKKQKEKMGGFCAAFPAFCEV